MSLKPTGKFITPEELDRLRAAQSCPVMFLSGGQPMGGDPQAIVKELGNKYAMAGCPISTKDGQFYSN